MSFIKAGFMNVLVIQTERNFQIPKRCNTETDIGSFIFITYQIQQTYQISTWQMLLDQNDLEIFNAFVSPPNERIHSTLVLGILNDTVSTVDVTLQPIRINDTHSELDGQGRKQA